MQEKIFRFFIGNQLTDKPTRRKGPGHGERSKMLGHVFIGASNPAVSRSCRTYSSLTKIASGDIFGMRATYWTPNTFYRNDIRRKNTLRWLNAVFIDIDEEGLTILDVLDRINAAGLPSPTMCVKTPHGWHVYWAIEQVRAVPKQLALYDAISRTIVKVLDGSDKVAFGAERYLRIPRDVSFFREVRYALSDFVTWREVFRETEALEEKAGVYYIRGCLSQPGIKELLKGVESGRRDNAGFTLALSYYKDGYPQEEALYSLQDWNIKNDPPLPMSVINSKVKSAYSGKYNGPSSVHVKVLSGISLHYRPITPPKPREERVRDHIPEIQDDIISYLESHNGRADLSQNEFANVLDVALRSFKSALKALRKCGKVIALFTGKGRARKAIYALLESVAAVIRERVPRGSGVFASITQIIQELMVHTHIHLGAVVGGSSTFDSLLLPCYRE